MKTKICTDCKIEKPITEFGKQGQHKDGLNSWCKKCMSKRQKIYQKKYRASGKANVTRNKWYNNNRKKYNRMLLKSHLKRHYGITVEQYEQMLANQNCVCAICKKPETSKNRKYLAVDHNHKTGKIRGLVCNTCNCLLGFAKDDPNILQIAGEYLKHE